MGEVSKFCKKCSLYKRTDDTFLYKQQPGWPGNSKTVGSGGILVVGPGPSSKADQKGFFSGPIGEAIRAFAADCEVPVHFHEALSCASSGAKPKHLMCCRKQTFKEVITNYRPQVVIAMGGNAVYWATGDKELRVNKVRHKIVQCDSFVLLALPHLSKDIRFCPSWARKNAEDLFDEYQHKFFQANQIAQKRGYKEPPHSWKIVSKKSEAMSLIRQYSKYDLACTDVETANSMHSILGKDHIDLNRLTIWHRGAWHICTSWTFPIPVKHPKRGGAFYGNHKYESIVFIKEANCREVNRYLFDNPDGEGKRTVIGHNIMFDNKVFQRFQGFNPWELSNIRDTFHLFSLQDSSLINYGLKPLAKKYLGADDWDEVPKQMLKDLQDESDVPVTYGELPIKEVAKYNALDTYYTMRLYMEIVLNDYYPNCHPLAEEVCYNQARYLSRVEFNGLPLNRKTYQKRAEENYLRLIRARKDFFSLKLVRKALATGVDDSISSKNFQEELVRVTRVKVPRTAKSGQPSLKAETVSKLGGAKFDKDTKELIERDEWDTPEQEVWWKFVKLRKIEHLNSNFFDSYSKYIVNGFVRPQFHVCKSEKTSSSGASGGGTKTGRLSTSAPQGQNLGGNIFIRDCFEAPFITRAKFRELKPQLQPFEIPLFEKLAGRRWVLCEADYNRFELVWLAFLTQDPKMVEIMKSGVDFHEATARELFDIPEGEEVPKDKRSIAKNLNFGLVYGQGAKAFAKAAEIPLDQAIKFFKKFHKTFPGVKKFFKENEKKVLNGELIETVYGRRRSFTLTGDTLKDAGQQREADNTKIQGPASDCCTEHLAHVFRKMDASPHLNNMIIPINAVHDSIWFLLRAEYAEGLAKLIKEWMEDLSIFKFPFDLPIEVEVKIGKKLSKMKKVEI